MYTWSLRNDPKYDFYLNKRDVTTPAGSVIFIANTRNYKEMYHRTQLLTQGHKPPNSGERSYKLKARIQSEQHLYLNNTEV